MNESEEIVVQVNLRLGKKELDALDEARPSTVPRTHWIRGAIRQRLGWDVEGRLERKCAEIEAMAEPSAEIVGR